MIQTQPKVTVVETDKDGLAVNVDGRKTTITWAQLKDASRNNGTLTDFYRNVTELAEARIFRQVPADIAYGYYNTNVWGVFGLAGNGEWYHIRRWHQYDFPVKWLAADEGTDNYTEEHAKKEAEAISARINKIWPSKRVSVVRHPSLKLGYAIAGNNE